MPPANLASSLRGVGEHITITQATLFLILLPLALVVIYRIWWHPLAAFPGPKSLAITSLPVQWRGNINGQWVREVAKLHRKYGPIVRIGPNHLALDGSIGWPQVYAHRAGKPEFSKLPGFFFNGDHMSIISAGRDDHRRHRRQLAHAFSEAALVEQEDLINNHIDLLMKQLQARARSMEPVNIVNWLNFTTFDIVGELAFGESFGSLKNSDYHPWVLNFFKGVRGDALGRMLNFYPLLKVASPLLFGTEDRKRSKENQEMSMAKAQSRMALGDIPPSGRRDFMTYMLKKNKDGEPGLKVEEVLINSPLLIGAGSETTASALSGFFFYMGQNPVAYKRLTEEVRSSFASESEITIKSTGQLRYLHASIEETLRVYPPASETPPRICPGEVIGDKYVPPKTVISVYQWATFRNPSNFADPDVYRPERWLPPTHAFYDHKYAGDNRAVFKPFSHGPRDCIGKNLAYSEMRVVISRILYRFDFRLLDGQLGWHDKQAAFLVWDKGPLMIELKEREGSNV